MKHPEQFQEIRDHLFLPRLAEEINTNDKTIVRELIVKFLAEGDGADAEALRLKIMKHLADTDPRFKGLNDEYELSVRMNQPWPETCLQFIEEELANKSMLAMKRYFVCSAH